MRRMGLALDTLSKEADEGTAECITYDQVQESLKKLHLQMWKRTLFRNILPI